MNPSGSQKKKIWIASDHAGYELKEKLRKITSLEGPREAVKIEWVDLGCETPESTDYPLASEKLSLELRKNLSDEELLDPRGVLICGSGVGVSMGANRYPWVRAVLALREDIAQFSRSHNASNVLCLGGRLLSLEEAQKILIHWFKTPFDGGRHAHRVALLGRKIQ